MFSPASSLTPSDPGNLPSPSTANISRLIHSWGYIKMRDAYALQNQFLGFSETERDDLLCSLWEIINKHAEYGVSVTIDANRYSVAFKKRIARTLDSPYFILNDHFVRGVIQAELERSMTRTVDFILDEQGHEWKDVEIFWKLRQLGAPHWMKRRI